MAFARGAVIALVAGVLFGLGGTAAYAIVLSSDWHSVTTIDGMQESNRAAVENPPKRGFVTARSAGG